MDFYASDDMDGLSELYTEDCKIMATGKDVLTGKAGRARRRDC